MKSIVSYPSRGKWEDKKYRGNCTRHIIKDLLEQFKPADGEFVEVFRGGETDYSVARSMGYKNTLHLDLNGRYSNPFNALTYEVPQGSSLVFSQPPYHSMIKYSGNMWGEAHADDLSRCTSYEEFLHKLLEGTDKAKKNQHWKAKIRQTLQLEKEFAPVDRGIWSLQSAYQQSTIKKFI
ncbi:hypothetical protein [Domibacillus robiginosus]|uniref:hypothetical protein n=1 Tax=Domibacillus robiginosus TaxID=1071054 RepID=UPI00067C8D42|nr:hypothetical protein [Domibacillus robiginosus]